MSSTTQPGGMTEDQLKELEQAIQRNVPQAMGGRDDFCNIWPSAKTGLQALSGILTVVPGVSVFAASAISIVVAAGDAAHRALCGR